MASVAPAPPPPPGASPSPSSTSRSPQPTPGAPTTQPPPSPAPEGFFLSTPGATAGRSKGQRWRDASPSSGSSSVEPPSFKDVLLGGGGSPPLAAPSAAAASSGHLRAAASYAATAPPRAPVRITLRPCDRRARPAGAAPPDRDGWVASESRRRRRERRQRALPPGGQSRRIFVAAASTACPLLTRPRPAVPVRGALLAGVWGIALPPAHPGIPAPLLTVGSWSGVLKSRRRRDRRPCSLRLPLVAERARSLRPRAMARSTSVSGVVRGGRVPRRVRLSRVMISARKMTLLFTLSRSLPSGMRRLVSFLLRPSQDAFSTGRIGSPAARMPCVALWPSPGLEVLTTPG
jgi:hypothetical protein